MLTAFQTETNGCLNERQGRPRGRNERGVTVTVTMNEGTQTKEGLHDRSSAVAGRGAETKRKGSGRGGTLARDIYSASHSVPRTDTLLSCLPSRLGTPYSVLCNGMSTHRMG